MNDGFEKLRDCVTKVSANKKLSKADTLREAVKYIQHLRKVLEEGGATFDAAGWLFIIFLNLKHFNNFVVKQSKEDVTCW